MSATRTPRRREKRIIRPLGAALPEPSARRAAQAPPSVALIATDGSRPAGAALKLGRLMAAEGKWTPNVLTVMLPLPVSVGEMMLPAPAFQYEELVSDSIGQRIRHQLKRYGDVSWRLGMEFGRPIPLIVRVAKERHASLIVLGLSRHGRIARLLGAETAARITRHTDIPVLAVHPGTRGLPKVAIAAVDFSESSVRAVREALALLKPPARLHLVHVKWSHNLTSFADSEWEHAYAAAAADEFARLKRQVGAKPGIEITTALLTGNVVEEIIREAKAIRANVVALGSHGQNVFDRLIIGSTPAELLRAAPCSVLVAPPADVKP